MRAKIVSRSVFVILFLVLFMCVSCGEESPSEPTTVPPKTGNLQIISLGLGSHLSPNITVTGPGSFVADVTSDTLFEDLREGSYTITSSEVVDTTGDTIFASTPIQQVAIEANKTTSVIANYVAPQRSSMSISVNGLPSGASGRIRIMESDGTLVQEITSSSQINSLLVGEYTIIAYPVWVNGADSLYPDPDSLSVTVVFGQLIDVTINYSTAFTMRVFAQQSRGSIAGSISAIQDGNNFSDNPNNYDPGSAISYENDGCRLILVDVTETGFTKSISGNTGGGSLSSTQTLSVNTGSREVTLSTSTSLTAGIPAAQTWGQTTILSETRTMPYVLQFDNPHRDTVEVTFSWSVSGSASGGGSDPSRAGASVQAWMHLPTVSCFTNLYSTGSVVSFNQYSDHNGNDTNPLTSDTTIIFSNSFYMIGVDLQTKCMAWAFYENKDGNLDGSGSGTGDLTVTLTAEVRKR